MRSRGELDHHSDRDRMGLFGIVQDVTQQGTHELSITEARSRAEEAALSAKILAETDQLTQIPNRRRVTADLTNAVMTSRSDGNAVSVALFDIDHFKRVNDTFGHRMGDEVLKRVAETARPLLPASTAMAHPERQPHQLQQARGAERDRLPERTFAARHHPFAQRCAV